jgi:predicted nucleic acid-binding protein
MIFLQAAARPTGPAAALLDLAFAAKADFLVTRDKDILDLRDSVQLTRAFDELAWQFRIVDPFEMLCHLRDEE